MSSHHANALPVGTKVQEYTIEALLGHGGFGLTYRAHDSFLDSIVAIKEYLPQEFAVREGNTVTAKSHEDGDAFRWGLSRFKNEARALAKFKHPNIVRVSRLLEANDTAYMVMDYEAGHTLGELLKHGSGTLEEDELRECFLPLLDGLDAMHRVGLVHRDIKPGNIYLRDNGSPMLIDFGAVRQAMGAHSKSITAVVTPGFAPIEQYSTNGKQGPWTDLYAVGATMYACILGRAPVDAARRSVAVSDAGRDPLVSAARIGEGRYSETLLACVDWALQFHSRDRPQSAGELRDALLGARPVPTPKAQRTPDQKLDATLHGQPAETRVATEVFAPVEVDSDLRMRLETERKARLAAEQLIVAERERVERETAAREAAAESERIAAQVRAQLETKARREAEQEARSRAERAEQALRHAEANARAQAEARRAAEALANTAREARHRAEEQARLHQAAEREIRIAADQGARPTAVAPQRGVSWPVIVVAVIAAAAAAVAGVGYVRRASQATAEARMFAAALGENSIAAYERYLSSCTACSNRTAALDALARLRQQAESLKVEQEDTVLRGRVEFLREGIARRLLERDPGSAAFGIAELRKLNPTDPMLGPAQAEARHLEELIGKRLQLGTSAATDAARIAARDPRTRARYVELMVAVGEVQRAIEEGRLRGGEQTAEGWLEVARRVDPEHRLVIAAARALDGK